MNDNSIDFKKLIDKMQKARVADADRPTVLGGQFAADRLAEFLNAWQGRLDQMRLRLWEHISHVEFADAPNEPEFLQRAEVFGEGGHLYLRRDGAGWLWHYVGKAVELPLQEFGVADSWATHPDCKLRRYAESVILWSEGKESDNLWFDGRVAAAQLNYPVDPGDRVYLHFWRYTEDGQTAFVWYRKLSNQPLQKEESS